MSIRKHFRLDKAAYMTEVGEQNILSPMYGAAVRWFSCDKAVATVSDNGIVTAIGNGDTVIVAETADGARAECKVSGGDYCGAYTGTRRRTSGIRLVPF